MMIKKNNKGFGAYELLSMVLVCLVLAAIVWIIAFKTNYNEKYKVFRYNAKIFALNGATIKIDRKEQSISLMELINEGYFTNIKNPFIGDKFCNINESKVKFKSSKRYTTLRCGNYIIDDQYVGEKKYKVYQITIDWQQNKPRAEKKEIDTKLAYNYQKNNKLVYDRFYDSEVFIYKFNMEHNTEYKSIDDIPHKYNVIERRFYRVKKLLMEVDAN